VWRIRSEETVLFDVLGDGYRDYAADRSRLLPGVY
jgi:protein-S-isoprenylcysteine O-methyltransferase Ste14